VPLTPGELQNMETQAAELAGSVGRLLLDRFRRPMVVEYKGNQAGKNPVTEADREAEAFLVKELGRRFPGHGMVGEEGADTVSDAALLTWVVDPLDGTTNYVNGLPLFACSIALLEDGVPMVGAIFVPWPDSPGGRVLHARKGGGAWVGETRLAVAPELKPVPGRVAVLTGVYGGRFKLGQELRRSPGERRSVGSIAYEMALGADGTYQYVLFGSPHSWDVAAGILLVAEAGGQVATIAPGGSAWRPFERFGPSAGEGGTQPAHAAIREWAAPILAGNPDIVGFVSDGLTVRRSLRRRLFGGVAGAGPSR
jgi:myo-inositol-1(or 4)-monophosphatase